jgi:hypothetical protein
MGFSGVRELVDAELDGQTWYSTWRKSPSQATTIGIWFDLSMSPGSPVPQYYASAPGVGAPMAYSDQQGMFHGRNVAPGSKHLSSLTVMSTVATALPMPMMLCDYLYYYPFIDEGSTDEQLLDNTAPLPRYASGEGVQMMAVSVAGRTGGQSFTVSYTNSDGVAGRTTGPVVQNSVSLIGSIVTSDRAVARARGPFLPLQAGDSGVRSIDSVTMAGADVGLFTLVLVKPLAQLQLRGIDAPVEANYLTDFGQLPTIVDDAYLNFLACPSGSLAATALHGDISVVWST